MPDQRSEGADGVSEGLARLAGAMRARGSRVGLGDLLGAHRALAAVEPSDRREAYLALRASLCSSREDIDRFAAAFGATFTREERDAPFIDPVVTANLPRPAVPDPVASGPVEPDLDEIRPSAWSDVELLRDKDFAAFSDSERALGRHVLARLARRGPTRQSRRTRSSRRRGEALDTRATLRAALRLGGEPFERRWREPRPRPRPLVLVCDVSGSMEPYSRMLLAYAHACVAAKRGCEAFAFSTRLSRITRELDRRDPDVAVTRATSLAADWSGGTRIGEAIAALNREHGNRVGRGAVVTILSDGWDRGEPELLEREVARLARCAHRLVWLNPLSAVSGYEPLARGMATALPHVDLFMAGNTLRSLERVAEMTERGLPRARRSRA